jgi:hypothetical protein
MEDSMLAYRTPRLFRLLRAGRLYDKWRLLRWQLKQKPRLLLVGGVVTESSESSFDGHPGARNIIFR